MPFSGGTAGTHDDSMHQGSAKRDVAEGLAGLDVSGHVLAPGHRFTAARGAAEQITIRERTSDERVFRFIRIGVDDYEARVNVGGVEKVVQHEGLKDVANGIAGLDASVEIPLALLKMDVANGIAGLDASAEVIARLAYENVANGLAGLDASVEIPLALLKMDVANGIAGLDASALLPDALLTGIGGRYIISDDLLHSHNTGATSAGTSYVKVKTITINSLYPTPSTIRIKFDLASSVTAWGKIYKNGAPVGTERSKAGSSWETFTEDLSFAEGDTIELWTKSSDEIHYAQSRNFRIYGVEHDQTLAEAINQSDAGGADAWSASNS